MRLHDVANAFNNAVCADGYTGQTLFSGQLALYDDNKRDSVVTERRVLSLAPSVAIPARRVIAAAGTRYVVGHGTPDDFRGSTIRVGYVLHEATFLSNVRTIAQVCLGQTGFTAYAGRAWVKDAVYSEHNSNEAPLYQLHYSSTETVLPNQLATFGNRLYVVRSTNYGASGTLVALCEEIAEPSVESVSFLDGVYEPVQDVFLGSSIPVTVVRMRWQSLFTYSSSMAPKFEPGDIQLGIAKAATTPLAGSTIVLSDGSWRIASVVSEGNAWLCRATRYG
jgi:hypothetical protein